MPKQVCEDCTRPIDEEQCSSNREYCVDCCACPEHGKECGDCGELTKSTSNLCQGCYDQWFAQAVRGGR